MAERVFVFVYLVASTFLPFGQSLGQSAEGRTVVLKNVRMPVHRAQFDNPAWRAKTLALLEHVETSKSSVAMNQRNLK